MERSKVYVTALLLAGPVVLALLLRLVVLDARSVWFDEAFSVQVASSGLSGIITRVSKVDLHPPLYYVILHLWMRLGRGPEVIRSLSAVYGTLTVALAWLLARRIGGRILATLAAVFLATSALAIQSSTEARMYAQLGFISTAATLLLDAGAHSSVPRTLWIAYAVALAAALYTHYVALLLILAHALYVLVWLRPQRGVRLCALYAIGSALVVFLPWWWLGIRQFSRFGGEWIEHLTPAALLNVGAASAFGGYIFGLGSYLTVPTSWTWQQVALVSPFLALAMAGALAGPRVPCTRLLLLCWLVPVLGLAIASVSMGSVAVRARYLSFVQSFFTILIANGILAVGSWVQRRWPAVLALSTFVIVPNLWVLQRSYADPRVQPYDWAGAVQHVRARWQPGDGFVFYPHYARIAFGYYAPWVSSNAVTLYQLSPRAAVSREEMVRALPPIEKALRGAGRVWVVMTTPSTVESREAILEAVEQAYRRKEFADFRYVWVLLYERPP
jgi:uncharacterized membrane protein